MNLKPKPCPFCGQVPFVFGRRVRDFADGKWAEHEREEFWISPKCRIGCVFGSTHSTAFGICDGMHFKTAEAAVKAWNTRAGDGKDWDKSEREGLKRVIEKLGKLQEEEE